jgi:hypothetical protein
MLIKLIEGTVYRYLNAKLNTLEVSAQSPFED